MTTIQELKKLLKEKPLRPEGKSILTFTGNPSRASGNLKGILTQEIVGEFKAFDDSIYKDWAASISKAIDEEIMKEILRMDQIPTPILTTDLTI